MFQYQCMFIGSILALLLTNISCNIKDDKNSKYSGFDPNLKRNKREIIDLNNSDSILYVKEAPFLKHPWYIIPKEEIKEEEKS